MIGDHEDYVNPLTGFLLARLGDRNPDALLLEPRRIYDGALVDITDAPDDQWPRKEKVYVAVYGIEKCISAIMYWFEVDQSEAVEWFYYNTSGAWQGEGTPTFRLDAEEE